MATGGPARGRMRPEGESGEDSDHNKQTVTKVRVCAGTGNFSEAEFFTMFFQL